jgi:hypothetical protein
MHHSDALRYGLWCATALTANANRRHYRMPTTWLPHLALNTAALLLPDLLRALGGRVGSQLWLLRGAEEAAASPAYVWHIAPFTAGYLTSHPRFDIYKGPLGELRLAGFGLDALPHALTAMSLTLLVADVLPPTAAATPETSPLGPALRLAADHPLAAAGVVLAALTALWEIGEWRALHYELERCGDRELVNMQWSVPDMLRDCVANAAGWTLACALRR